MDAEPAADAEALERLAVWALKNYSPIVATDLPDGIVIDATGAAHLHGGEEAMLGHLLNRLSGSGFLATAAMADTWGAAHALARYVARPSLVIPAGKCVGAVAGLPLASLRLPGEMVAELQRLGFKSIQDLLDQPRAPLVLRFGSDLSRRLDQATGAQRELIERVRSPELVEAKQVFAEPIGAPETIAKYISRLVGTLCQALERQSLGARRLDLLCHRVDNRVEVIRVGMATPVRDVKRLTRLLTDRIETIDPGFGIEIMTIVAVIVEPLESKQRISSLVEETDVDISNLVDVLMNRVGERRIYRLEPIASDVPERSVKRVAALAPRAEADWPDHWPRPARLLPRPDEIETMALLPDHPPVWFIWRGIRHRMIKADGPERVFGEWWKADPELVAVRDYFRVEDENGERFWIFRAGDGEDPATGSHKWFIHGIYG
jgi:protein ImuB